MGERVMTELTNMVMVYDEKGRALVQERRLRWKGLSFPGGHVEPNESFMASAISLATSSGRWVPSAMQRFHARYTSSGSRCFMVYSLNTSLPKISGRFLISLIKSHVLSENAANFLRI